MGKPKVAEATTTCPAIHAAIRRGYFQQVRFLIDMGHGVNERDGEGRTALMLCSLVESADWGVGLARTLLESGAKVCHRDRRGLNALHYACVYRRPGIVALYLAGMDFDVLSADRRGNTALHYSVTVGDHVSTALLARAIRRYDLRLDKENARGLSPLALAWRCGNLLCARILVGFGSAAAAAGSAAAGVAETAADDDGSPRRDEVADAAAAAAAAAWRRTSAVTFEPIDDRPERKSWSAKSDSTAMPPSPRRRLGSSPPPLQTSSTTTTRATSGVERATSGARRSAGHHGRLSWRDAAVGVAGVGGGSDAAAAVDRELPLDVTGGSLIKNAHPADPRNDPEYVFGLNKVEYFENRGRLQQHHPLPPRRADASRAGDRERSPETASWRGEFQSVWSTYEQQCSPSFLHPAKPSPHAGGGGGRGGASDASGHALSAYSDGSSADYAYGRRGSRTSKPPSRATLGSAHDRKTNSRVNSRKGSVATLYGSASQSVSRVSLLTGTGSESGQ